MRRWGSQYWWANQNAYYSNLMPANRMELMDPTFDMYTSMLPAKWKEILDSLAEPGNPGLWAPPIPAGSMKLPSALKPRNRDLRRHARRQSFPAGSRRRVIHRQMLPISITTSPLRDPKKVSR